MPIRNQLILVLLLLFSGFCCATNTLIPKPTSVTELDGVFVFKKNTAIICTSESLKPEAMKLRRLLQPATGFTFENKKSKVAIFLTRSTATDQIAAEGYQLKVTPTRIEIKAGDAGGFYYAFQTLLQLLPAEIYSDKKVERINWNVKAVLINDSPKYAWRGAMLDVSRQFYELSYLKKYIHWLAVHKLNVFHMHLTDDEGWRIEIKALPKLTELGAWRGPNELLPPAYGSGEKRYGGFYTQDQLKELVQYAAERNVQIIPEIDVPGHSKAVAAAYPEMLCVGNDTTGSAQGVKKNVWCAAREQNYEMIDKIIGEVAAVFPSEYIHIGGDEVNHKAWENCSLCIDLMRQKGYDKSSRLQSYFIARVEAIVAKHGKKMIGWNEILETDSLRPETAIMVWTTPEAGLKAVQRHQPVVLSTASYLYLDMAQGVGERGHKWATLLPAERVYSFEVPSDSLSNIYVKGIQGNLWAEYLDQPFDQTDYQSYPRLCALAELAWSGKQSSYANFESRLNAAHLDRLYWMGVHFRVPTPIVQHSDGKWLINNKLDNAKVYYTADDSLQLANWKLLDKTAKQEAPIRKFHFRTIYRDSLVSHAVALTYDTLAVWNKSVLASMSSDSILYLDLNQTFESKNTKSLLLRYCYGGSQLAIKRVRIFNQSESIFEKSNEKPLSLFSRTSEWEVFLPENVMNERGIYRMEILLTGRKPTDSSGVVLLIPQ